MAVEKRATRKKRVTVDGGVDSRTGSPYTMSWLGVRRADGRLGCRRWRCSVVEESSAGEVHDCPESKRCLIVSKCSGRDEERRLRWALFSAAGLRVVGGPESNAPISSSVEHWVRQVSKGTVSCCSRSPSSNSNNHLSASTEGAGGSQKTRISIAGDEEARMGMGNRSRAERLPLT